MQFQLHPHVASLQRRSGFIRLEFYYENSYSHQNWSYQNVHLYYLPEQIPQIGEAFDIDISRFRGWISIKGLPFESWCTNTFK